MSFRVLFVLRTCSFIAKKFQTPTLHHAVNTKWETATFTDGQSIKRACRNLFPLSLNEPELCSIVAMVSYVTGKLLKLKLKKFICVLLGTFLQL